MCRNCDFLRALQAPVMGVAEVAKLFGVTPQRVYQLDQNHPDFPEPLARLKSGPVFCAVDVYEFLRTWDRRPGRPPIRREVTKGETE
jgi:hypothetical protein